MSSWTRAHREVYLCGVRYLTYASTEKLLQTHSSTRELSVAGREELQLDVHVRAEAGSKVTSAAALPTNPR